MAAAGGPAASVGTGGAAIMGLEELYGKLINGEECGDAKEIMARIVG